MINPFIYFLLFLKASLFSTGGFSNLPSLHQDLIANGWATDLDFGQSIAIGQISPGPNGLWVISLGYLTYGYLGRLHTHRTSTTGARRYARCLTRRRRAFAYCRLDDSASTWSGLERAADS